MRASESFFGLISENKNCPAVYFNVVIFSWNFINMIKIRFRPSIYIFINKNIFCLALKFGEPVDFFRWFGLIFGVIEKTYLMAKWVAYNLYYVSWEIAISSETNFLPKEWTYDKNLLNINLRMVVFAQKIFYTLFPEKQQKSLKLTKLTTWIYLYSFGAFCLKGPTYNCFCKRCV